MCLVRTLSGDVKEMENRKLFDQAKRQVMEHPTLMDDVPFTVAVHTYHALAG